MHGWTSEIRFVLRTFFPGNGIGVSGNSCKVNNIRPAIGAQYFFYEYPKNGGFSSSGNFTTSIFITQRNIQGDTMKARVIIITLIFSLLISLGLSAQVQQNSFINLPDSPIQVFAEVETGFVKVLSHTFQSGDTGTNFNFVTQGGQEILFPFQRVTLGANLGDRHLISALYQPLTIETEVTFRDDVTIDGVSAAFVLFECRQPRCEIKYGFPFWRFTYGYTISSPMKTWMCTAAWPCSCATLLSYFQEIDGPNIQATTNQNLGPVPALFTEVVYTLPSGIELNFEATGLYASSALINGANFEFEGSILDTSLRLSVPLQRGVSTFLNVRFLGGTAVGVSEFPDRFWTQAQEDFTSNKLATLSLTAGVSIR
jgi:hypothetical protein